MTTKKLKTITVIALIGAALSLPVLAQSGNGNWGGPGMMNSGAGNSQMGPGMRGGRGAGAGMRQGGRGGRGMMAAQGGGQGYAVGASLMTLDERNAQMAALRKASTYEECKQVQTAHRAVMETRAKEKGVTLPVPRQNGCDRMQARGFFN